jgi:hypothetical protein
VTEVLIVTFSHIQNLFQQIFSWRLGLQTILFMLLLPMVELVFSTAVEGVVTFAALEQGLLRTHLAVLHSGTNLSLVH